MEHREHRTVMSAAINLGLEVEEFFGLMKNQLMKIAKLKLDYAMNDNHSPV